MKKIILSIGLYCAMLGHIKAQDFSQTDQDFIKRKLKIEEINLVTGYYQQDGDKSAVTGGIGTEYLTDFENSLDIVVSKQDRFGRKHRFTLDANIDFYTSASSDNIDPLTRGSASSNDVHFYPSLTWNIKDEETGRGQTLSYAFSKEYDYTSHGIIGGLSLMSKDKNTELNLRGSAYFDTYMAILPPELRPINYPSGSESSREGIAFKGRNTYALAASIAQVFTERLQLLVMVEPSFQHGFLSTPFHRTYFSNGDFTVEKLPNQRLKLPVGFRGSYFLGDRFVFRGFYRFYWDNWGMLAHTGSLEIPYKISPFFSLSPFFRYNLQGKIDYFRPYAKHGINQEFYTSDYDLSTFESWFLGSGIRLSPPGGLMGISQLNSMEFRYGFYSRSNGLQAHSITLALKIK